MLLSDNVQFCFSQRTETKQSTLKLLNVLHVPKVIRGPFIHQHDKGLDEGLAWGLLDGFTLFIAILMIH